MSRQRHSLVDSFRCAIRGFTLALREQRNAQIQVGIAAVVVIVAWLLEVMVVDWCLLALCIGLVLSTEVMNTAVETVVDLVTEEHHELAGKAKDIAAGASLIAAITAAVVGGMVLLPPLLEWIQTSLSG